MIVFATAAASYFSTVVTDLSAIKSEMLPLPPSQRCFARQLKTTKFQLICRAKLFPARRSHANFLTSKSLLTILISSLFQFVPDDTEFTVAQNISPREEEVAFNFIFSQLLWGPCDVTVKKNGKTLTPTLTGIFWLTDWLGILRDGLLVLLLIL